MPRRPPPAAPPRDSTPPTLPPNAPSRRRGAPDGDQTHRRPNVDPPGPSPAGDTVLRREVVLLLASYFRGAP